MKTGSVDIFGVRIDMVSGEDAIKAVDGWVKGAGKYMLLTPNIEFIMAAQKDTEFKSVLNKADLAIPDSSRLSWAYEVISHKTLLLRLLMAPLSLAPFLMPNQKFQALTGVDLMQFICKDFSEKGFTVGFLGGREGVAKKAAECLQKKYSGLKVSFAESGPKVDLNGDEVHTEAEMMGGAAGASRASTAATEKSEDAPEIPERQDPLSPIWIPHSFPKCDILFVAFGQVKQEKWIAKNLPKIPVKVAMGIGGSLDEIAGVVPRPPGWVSVLGLKWLFRLITEPRRLKRQLVLPRFVLKVITS